MSERIRRVIKHGEHRVELELRIADEEAVKRAYRRYHPNDYSDLGGFAVHENGVAYIPSSYDEEQLCEVVAHELAHLVTPELSHPKVNLLAKSIRTYFSALGLLKQRRGNGKSR